MKKLVALLFSLAVMFSCSQEKVTESVTGNASKQIIEIAGKTFDVASKQALLDAGLLIAKQAGALNAQVINSEFQRFVPKIGDPFDGVKVVYKSGDTYTTTLLPVEVSQSDKGARKLVVGGCSMTCNSSTFCHGCEMDITEKCKKIKCTCTQGNGDCDPNITFPAE